MGYLFILTAILAENIGKTIAKYNFNKTKAPARELMLLDFTAMTLVVSLFVAVTNPDLPLLSTTSVLIFSSIVLVSFVSNFFEFLGVKSVDLAFREPISNFRPILSGLIAFLVFPDERSLVLLLAFIAGSLVLYWSVSYKTLSKTRKKGAVYVLLGVLFKAILPILFGLALEYAPPEYIALIRLGGIWMLSLLIFRSARSAKVNKQRVGLSWAAGTVYGIGSIVGIYAIDVFGVAATMALMLLGPALRYIFSYVLLREKVTSREVAASLLLAIIVVIVGVSN